MARKGKSRRKKIKGKMAIEFAALKIGSAGVLPEKLFHESADGSRKGERSVQTYSSNRRCECCGATLSRYNSDKLCWPCDKAIAEWKNFPMNRSEIERTMSVPCLQYVREKLTKKKRVDNTVGGEVSSGSWARATGRKTLERK